MAKFPVRKKTLKLSEPYEAFSVTVRTNVPFGVYEDLQSEDFPLMREALAEIILEWDLTDEEGKELGKPDAETIRRVPLDLIAQVMAKFGEASNLPNQPAAK